MARGIARGRRGWGDVVLSVGAVQAPSRRIGCIQLTCLASNSQPVLDVFFGRKIGATAVVGGRTGEMKILPTEGLRGVPTSATVRGPIGPPVPPEQVGSGPAPGSPPSESFSAVMTRLGRRIDQGQRDVDRAARGGPGANDPGAMIALQAQVYRYVESVDLASKLVDRMAGAVKTTLQGQ